MRKVSWYGIMLLLLIIAGCKEERADRDVRTEVACASDSSCDRFGLECTSTFDETVTTVIDEFGVDAFGGEFDRFSTLEDRTQTLRRDDIDDDLVIVASFQEERFTATTTEEEIRFNQFGDEERILTQSQGVTLTTWTQDCPDCPVVVCTSTEAADQVCFIQTFFPEFPVCDA